MTSCILPDPDHIFTFDRGLQVKNEGANGELKPKFVRAVYLEEELHNIHSKWNEYLRKMRNSYAV